MTAGNEAELGSGRLWVRVAGMNPEERSSHAQAAQERQIAIYRAMSPQQRLRQAHRMNANMRALLAAGFRQRHPAWTEEEVRRAVCQRILHARTD